MDKTAAAPGIQNAVEERQLAELNDALTILIEVFPNVLPDVFREMLVRFDGDSCLEVVINHLLRSPEVWAKGRLRPAAGQESISGTGDISRISATDLFRRNSYKWAVKANLLQEFKPLSKSTVKAVLAEKNNSYTLARPVLQDIASRSWRHSINRFFSRWSRSTDDVSEKHGMIQWTKSPDGTRVPVLKETGDPELDSELHQTVLAPLYARYRAQQEANDRDIAGKVNEAEAIDADALFECGCCFRTTTFEQMASCTTSLHIVCFECMSRAVSEALFGQSWGQIVDLDRALLRCLVPTAGESCRGCVPHEITQRAIYQSHKGVQTWLKFETRLREEALTKAQVPLVRCPVCSYAESTDLYLPPGSLRYSLDYEHPLRTLLYIFFVTGILPVILVYLGFTHLRISQHSLPSLTTLLRTSLTRLANSALFPVRFRCRTPTCLAQTCITCSQPWLDPHNCSSPSTSTDQPTSLRTHIEAARTAALKRTCPRCNTSFIKDSGCNKLTCVCGYTMCYVCRQGLGEREGGEGYRHFCQHFRVNGGSCGECERCDLYGGEEGEGERVEVAGRRAEREWRERWGLMKGGGDVVKEKSGKGKEEDKEEGRTIQGVVNWWVRSVVIVKERSPLRGMNES